MVIKELEQKIAEKKQRIIDELGEFDDLEPSTPENRKDPVAQICVALGVDWYVVGAIGTFIVAAAMGKEGYRLTSRYFGVIIFGLLLTALLGTLHIGLGRSLNKQEKILRNQDRLFEQQEEIRKALEALKKE